MSSSSKKPQTGHSDVVTQGVRIKVASQYLPEQSSPDDELYAFAYRVRILNEGSEPATLRSRRWVIRDADGEVEIVEGPGVIGEEPRLEPGEQFEYTSGCPLPTTWGTMEGHYVMERDDGSTFQAEVGRFFLAPTVAPISTQS
jgi:ApaG protein